MKAIGKIKHLQIQRFALKLGEKPNVSYNPAPLLLVPHLQLMPAGVIGITADGMAIIDVHNVQHPNSRNREGINGISFNFTSHYQTIRDTYGEHMYDGCAGENILIETNQGYQLEDLQAGIVIQNKQTQQLVRLTSISVAAPCLPFSLYTLNAPGKPTHQQIRETLQCLHHGRRGFNAIFSETSDTHIIQSGDIVFSLRA